MKTDSDDYSDDNGKKRRAENEIGIFERSKKIVRTPTKVQNKDEDKLDLILSMIKDMKEDQKEIKREVQQIRAEQRDFSEELRSLKKENEDLRRENETIKQENKDIRKELLEIKNTVEWIEKEKKKNNAIVNGLKMDTGDPKVIKEGMKNFVKKNMDVDINIKTATKLGEKTCLIELESDCDKIKLMENKAKLRYLKEDRVYINNDLTKKEREKQRQLKERAREEKEKGKAVKIGYNKIIIEGIEWRWNKSKEKLEQITKN